MSSHDCRVSGGIKLRADVSKQAVQAALADFLEHHGLDFETLYHQDDINISGSTLWLTIDVYGHGGEQSDDLDALVVKLNAIIDGNGYIEFTDFDTASDDDRCAPYFLGNDVSAARLLYGIEQMTPWVETIIGSDALAAVVTQVMALPRISDIPQ